MRHLCYQNSQAPGLLRLDIDVLKTFIAAAETSSVKRATERVVLSPAAGSVQIKKLERLIDALVFHAGALGWL